MQNFYKDILELKIIDELL